jgi:hypothetical protein
VAVELVDDTMISLARDIPMFRKTIEKFVRGDPAALLLVEFAEDDAEENCAKLALLAQMMGDLGFDWSRPAGKRWGGVVPVTDNGLQAAIAEVPQVRPQHHDVDEAGGQTRLLRGGLRRRAARPGRVYRQGPDGYLHQVRHRGHVVCPCLGRLPACAPRSEPASRTRT